MSVQEINISKLSKLSKLSKHRTVLKWFPLAKIDISDVWPSKKPFQNPSQRCIPPGVGGQVQPNANEFK